MKRGREVLLMIGFAALLSVSGYLYYKTQALNVHVQNALVPALRELKQLDAEWNSDILKSRVGLHSNYDPVTTPEKALRQLRERLVQGAPTTSDGKLQGALARMEKAFTEKEELVQQFKSQHAVLNNSLRYFPTAVEEFEAALKRHRDPFALVASVEQLLTDILRFNLIPERELGERIAATLGALERGHKRVPEHLQESFEVMLQHAGTILRQRVVEDAVLEDIAATSTAEAIDGVRAALDETFRAMLQEKQHYRNYLLLYSGLLLALLLYTAWRLMHSYRVIAQVNRRLQAANETLEQRVAERTAELEIKSAQLAELATHDTLTGLINRRQLMVQIEQALLRAERRGLSVALMFIDLDGFKAVNDSFGHAVGDRVLQEVAARLQRHLRKEDAFARLGGDEFVILMNEVSVPHGAIRVAEVVLDELRGLREVDGHQVCISASIGISVAHGASDLQVSPDALLNESDRAMYLAKQQGKNQFRFGADAV